MYFTPEEIAVLKENKIYKYYADTQWSTFTVATVLAHLDAVPKTSLESLPLIKFLLMVKKAKDAEEADQSRLNEGLAAYIVACGGDPATSSYPLKHDFGAATLGAGGEVAATEIIALVAGKKLCVYEAVITFVPSAGIGVDGGIIVEIEDSAAAPVSLNFASLTVGSNNVVVKHLPPGTSAKAINFVVTAAPTHVGVGKVQVSASYIEV